MSKTMYIMRGCPGSGKSTFVRKMTTIMSEADYKVCDCDDYFNKDDKYKFVRYKLHLAHKQCQEYAKDACETNVPYVFISNQNVNWREIRPYVRIAIDNDYTIELVGPSVPWAYQADELYKRNTHSVPLETIKRRLRQYQPDSDILDMITQYVAQESDSGVPNG